LNIFSSERRQKIILVSSTAGFLSFYGHSSYAPTKHAIRSLGDCLRHELDVSTGGKVTTHVYFTSTISSPGFEVEQRRAPRITKLIEGSGVDESCLPKNRAITLLNGIEKGQFHITSDFITDLLRVSMAGVSPRNGIVKDTFLLVLAWLFIPLWRLYIDVFVVAKNQ
jgi:3-dehydrosphinganine reductase